MATEFLEWKMETRTSHPMDGCGVSMKPCVGNVQDPSSADVCALQVAMCIAVKTIHTPSGPKHTLSLNQLYYHSSPLALWPPRAGAGVEQRAQPQEVEPVSFFPL